MIAKRKRSTKAERLARDETVEALRDALRPQSIGDELDRFVAWKRRGAQADVGTGRSCLVVGWITLPSGRGVATDVFLSLTPKLKASEVEALAALIRPLGLMAMSRTTATAAPKAKRRSAP